jgi:hypothetical protein
MVILADPEGADMIVVLYALAPYLGTLTNELVGNVTATRLKCTLT